MPYERLESPGRPGATPTTSSTAFRTATTGLGEK